MAGYIGSKASVISSKAGFKNTFAISTTTTLLEGVTYTVNRVNVFHNGVRLVDGTDYTATNGTSITLTSAAENGDQIVITSQADFNVANTYTQAQADATFLKPASTLDATKLSGALPAISGANLTGIAASLSALTDCTVSTSNPALNSNPTSGVGHMWINKTSGEQYILTDATAGGNNWINVGIGSVSIGPFVATGGTITTASGYKYHTFTSSGNFTTTQGTSSVEYMLVAGGGGSGKFDAPNYAGGGGAGGLLAGTFTAVAGGSTVITIGAGATWGNNGGASSIAVYSGSTTTAVGGGKGGRTAASSNTSGSGGSGGGSLGNDANQGSGTSGQGNAGGSGSGGNFGGGGGGKGAVGSNGGLNPGNGGAGVNTYSAWATATSTGDSGYYAGGGSGGTNGENATGGAGGGGSHIDGAANTGGGGGGRNNGTTTQSGRSGGSGIVILRYAV